jgi:hypothetical protein
MKILIGAFVLTVSMGASAASITLAKAAELTAHRVDRLVTLSKIDASFLKKAAKIEISSIENTPPAAFRAVVSQTAIAEGTALKLEIIFDGDGKALFFQQLPGGQPGPEPAWPLIDPITLLEDSLHYVLDNGTADSRLAPYLTSLSTVVLSKGQKDGQEIAISTMTSLAQPQKLKVYLKMDGTFISAEVAP